MTKREILDNCNFTSKLHLRLCWAGLSSVFTKLIGSIEKSFLSELNQRLHEQTSTRSQPSPLSELNENSTSKSHVLTLEEAMTPILPIFFSTLNLFFSTTASFGNVLILIALRKVNCFHPPTRFLFRSLAVADLLVGLIAQPLASAALVLPHVLVITRENSKQLSRLRLASDAFAFFFCGVSILISTTMSIDRLLALFLGVRYRSVVTLARMRIVVLLIVIISVLIEFLWLLWPYRSSANAIPGLIQVLLIAISTISFFKISKLLRQHCNQVGNSFNSRQLGDGHAQTLNIARCRKLASSVRWLHMGIVVCFVPMLILATVSSTITFSFSLTMEGIVLTLAFLNSTLNPILYCWKLREVRQAVINTVKQCRCF